MSLPLDPEPYYVVEADSRHSKAEIDALDRDSTLWNLAVLKPRPVYEQDLDRYYAPTVQATFTPPPRKKAPKRERETLDYIAFARRMIRAAGRRVGSGDEPELAALLDLQKELDDAIAAAVHGQRAIGRSWAHIALATGKTRSAAFQRWGGAE